MKYLRASLLPLALLIVVLVRLLKHVGVRIRYGVMFSSRIGHLVGHMDNYLCEKSEGLHKGLDIWAHYGQPCNLTFTRLLRRRILLDPTGFTLLLIKVNKLFAGWLEHEISCDNLDRDPQGLRAKHGPQVSLTQRDIAKGRKQLSDWGLPSKAKWVCLMVRDSAYLPTLTYHSYRDGDVDDYGPAMLELANRGYHVFRMGAKVSKPFSFAGDGVSVKQSGHDKENLQWLRGHESSFAAKILSRMSRGKHAQVAPKASELTVRAASESERSRIRERIRATGETEEEALRALRGQEYANAPRGLQSAATGEMAVQEMPPAATRQLKHPRIHDYATNGMRSDFMDVFLGAYCEFFVSTSCGWDAIPQAFRRPGCYANFVPYEYLPSWMPYSIAIWKHHYKNGKKMTLTEMHKSGCGQFMRSAEFEAAGIELRPNTPEEITSLVLEMIDLYQRAKRGYTAATVVVEEQREFWKNYPVGRSTSTDAMLHGTINLRIGRAFLRSHDKGQDSPGGDPGQKRLEAAAG